METLQRTANRGSVSTGYDITNSVKLEDTNTEYLQRAASGSDGNRRTMTLSMWLKRTGIGNDHIFYSQGSHVRFRFKTSDYFSLRLANGHEFEKESRLFRDPAAWYHMVVAVDTTQSTNTDRVKIYWNGVQETDFDTAQYPDLNEELTLGQFSSVTTQLGWFTEAGYGFDGYITEVNYIDGSQKAPTDFGEFDDDTGIWIPKQYTGSYGSEGFFLNFDDSSSMGADSSGNGKNFSLNNVSAADQATDTCTNNFATLNPIMKYPSSQVINEGATKVDRTSGSGLNKTFYATIPVFSGKFYFEAQPTEGSGQMIGVETMTGVNTDAPDSVYVGEQSTAVGYYASNGQKYTGASGSSYGNSYGTSDIIGVALDMDNRKVYFAKNNTYQNSGDPTSGSTGTGAIDLPDSSDGYVFAVSYDSGGQWVVNFGGFTTMSISSAASDGSYGTFEYAPPSGYYELCTKNLAEHG